MVRGLIDLLILPFAYIVARDIAKDWFERKYFHSKRQQALDRAIERLEALDKDEKTNEFKG